MSTGELDPVSGVPMYKQIKEILRREITSGTADPGVPMTEAQLLERFGVSRAPIRQALSDLTTEGFVYRKQGKGTFPVVGARVDRPADIRPGGLFQFLADKGLKPTSTVSEPERVVPPSRIRARLALPEDERLLHFTRLMSIDGEPLVDADVYIRSPEGFLPSVEFLEERGSAMELLEREYGITLDRAEHEAWATAATTKQAAALGVAKGSPLLAIETIFFSTGGVPAGWRLAIHQAEEFKYHFVT
ncbi:GntR family transcriptional regulator [Corynebacterium hylobatis]|uniref:GntR family transcriptional regulator n=1 Tax=Corynebacterium hylobatis TaxID=1859290 RepID=A0A3S0BJ97_9CORY|nr:GntR family transcriptional regulator [Corynebacterium hylobatis]RSZ65514.1 GntR family transcriptional regulator [Corynebacterium hylobatis]